MKKYILIIAVTLAAIAWLSLIPSYIENSYMLVESNIVEVSNSVKTVDCKGSVNAASQDTVVVGIPVKVVKQNFNIGDKVKAGQQLVEIDEDVIKQTLKYSSILSNSSLNSITSSSSSGSVDTESATSALKQAYSMGLIDSSTYNSLMEQIENSNGEVSLPASINLGNISSYQNNSDEETLESIKKSLCSKISGTIVSIKDGSEGIVPASTTLATVADMSTLEVSARVTEDEVKDVKVGQQALIYGDGFKGTYLGTVKKICPIVSSEESLTGSGNYVKVLLEINNTGNELFPGLTSNISIKISEKSNVATVPFDFIKQDDNSNEYVYVFKKGKAVKTPITTGNDNSDMVEVLKGLKSGDIVVTNVDDSIVDGSKIKLH